MKKILSVFILIIFILSMTCYSFATSVNDLTNQKTDITNQRKDAEQKIDQLEQEKDETLSQINELSDKIADSERELENLGNQIKELEASIKTTEKELQESEEKYQKQQKMFEARVVAQYKAGKTSYLDVLLGSDSFTSFLSKYYLLGKVAKADNALLDSIEAEKQKIERTKAELEKKKSDVKTAKANQEKTNVILINAKVQKNNQVAKLSKEQADLQKQIDEYDAEMKELERLIKKAEEEAKKGNGNNNFTYTGGQLAWPIPGYNNITSNYGMRIHPIYKVPKLHTGIDVGAPKGASFVAAEDGVVILAKYNGGYGNCVIINHGNGITTLYGHGTSILVSNGQTVKRGQPVLTVGSTGTSTGNHAHFEVRKNGSPVDPLPYLK